MLPSERLAGLTRKAVVIGVRKADPAAEALRKEFDARATGWLIVLDARGELLESGFADPAGAFKKRETAETFAGPFLDRVEKSLERKETLQDLERRWEKNPLDEAAFAALVARFEEMAAYARLREFCEKVAALPGLAPERRADALLRAFAARPREFNTSLGTPEGQALYVAQGERLIAEYAAHPGCAAAVQSLFISGYSGKFDVPARTAAGIARLEAAARNLKEPGALRRRIVELSRLCEEEMAKLRDAAKGDEAAEGWGAVLLGDAEATIRIFSKPDYEKSAFYQAFVKEARAKLQRQK